MKYRSWFVLTMFLIIAILLTACGPSATPTEEEIEKPPEPTEVEVVTKEAPPPEEETSIVILLEDEPPSFNAVRGISLTQIYIQNMVLLPMADIDPWGNIYTKLAADLPTLDNGGVVYDEASGKMDVTWKMREDIIWADGEPVTADDVIFTWNALTDPETGDWVDGVDLVDSIEKIDDFTFVVHYSTMYHGYILQFGQRLAIWPEHYCDAEQGFVNWDCQYEPLSDGPYILEEWEAGDHLTFVRNPNYYEDGKPYIDRIHFLVVPETTVRMQMLAREAGDINDRVFVTDARKLLDENPFIKPSMEAVPRQMTEICFNLAARGEIDPVEYPHPVLSDVRVRQAIRMAIDIDRLIEDVRLGLSQATPTFFNKEPYACPIPRPEYNPEKARALLEEAGWIDTDEDGVRECHGCTTGAPEGYVMAIEFMVDNYGGELQELTHQLIGEDLEDIGMDIELTVADGILLYAPFPDGGLEQSGDFDMDMWDAMGYGGTDPSPYIRYSFHSASAVPDVGWNVGRWMSNEFDALYEEAFTLDEDKRKEVFCQMAELLDEEIPRIFLFTPGHLLVYNDRIEGVQANANAWFTWNIADWKVVK